MPEPMKDTPMAKPKRPAHHRTAIGQMQRVKTRAWIIKCAIPVFGEHGPDIPVIDDFVRAAGVSRGTFYNYFQTTRELLDATMETLSDEVIATIVPAVAGMTDPVTRLATAARMYYRKATMDPLFGAFLESVSGVGTLAIERARGDLQEAIRSGATRVQDIELAQAIAIGACRAHGRRCAWPRRRARHSVGSGRGAGADQRSPAGAAARFAADELTPELSLTLTYLSLTTLSIKVLLHPLSLS
jgi:AcrR family transcriptional regulator